MATTTNYGWETPDDTDLVKDGAAAIRTLGSSIDTTTKNLNPETTTGDIAYRSATANTNTRLAIGTAGQVLTVNSGATAPEWATLNTGMTLLNSGGTTLTGAAVTISFTSTGYTNLQIQVKNAVYLADSGGFNLRINGDTGANYSSMRYMNYDSPVQVENSNTLSSTSMIIQNRGGTSTDAAKSGKSVINIYRPTDTDTHFINWTSSGIGTQYTNPWYVMGVGNYDASAAISSITLTSITSNFNGGTVYVYGVE